MIITLKGCTATAFIGGLNFFKVSRGTVSGASVTIATSTINKDEATSTSAREIATVALNSNYENLVVTVTMGGTTVNNWYKNGKVTIPANTTVTGDIKISASATAVVPDVPVTPDEPATPTMYTFTINPTPTTATVTLTASGYRQSGNSIKVPANTVVTWKVSASGYTEQSGTHTVTKTESKSVVLSESSSVVNLFTLKNSIPELLDNGYYRDTTGNIVGEDSQFNVKYPSSEKIYINGNGEDGDFKLNLQSGKVYRWECVPYFEFGYIKLGPPWGLSSSMTGKNFWFYNNNDALIANDKTTMTDASAGGYCMQIPDGAVYMRFMATGYRDNKSKLLPVLRDRLMVTEGETQYTEYVEPVV